MKWYLQATGITFVEVLKSSNQVAAFDQSPLRHCFLYISVENLGTDIQHRRDTWKWSRAKVLIVPSHGDVQVSPRNSTQGQYCRRWTDNSSLSLPLEGMSSLSTLRADLWSNCSSKTSEVFMQLRTCHIVSSLNLQLNISVYMLYSSLFSNIACWI